MAKALYIHIPFCHNICGYCDFTKLLYNEDYADRYIQRIKEDLKDHKELYKTIYIGGGSPSSLNYVQLNSLLEFVSKFKDADCEFSIEVNPEDMDLGKVNLLVAYGVNRVSIGVQTFNKKLLGILGRKHTKEDVLNLISTLRYKGINNISVDLMYGLPNQTFKTLKKDLKIISSLNLPHVSTYALLVEDNTCFKIKNIEALDDDIQADMYDFITTYLNKHGYNRYEVSNFAKEGFESKHNLVYWNAQEYKGIGCGASGYEDGIRYDNTRSLTYYLDRKNELEKETLSEEDKEYEYIILHLRLKNGFLISEFNHLFRTDFLDKYHNILKELSKQDLIIIDDRLRVKEEKMLILNQVLSYFTK